MDFLSGITLQSPEYLWAILAVPMLWWLLRLIPPEAIRRRFPSFRLLHDLPPMRAQTAFTPLWLLCLRGIMVICMVLGFANPTWDAEAIDTPPEDQPIILLIDNCWAAAPGWHAMKDKALAVMHNLPVKQNLAVIAACPQNSNYIISNGLISPVEAEPMLKQLRQSNQLANWPQIFSALQSLQLAPIAQLNIISSGIVDQIDDYDRFLKEIAVYDDVRFYSPDDGLLPVGLSSDHNKENLSINIQRLKADQGHSYKIVIRNANGILAIVPIVLNQGESEKTIQLDLPGEEMNDVREIAVDGYGAMARQKWPENTAPTRIGLATNNVPRNPLTAPDYYLARALSGQTNLIKGGWQELLRQKLPVIIAADPQLPQNQLNHIAEFLNNGGRLIRFASSELPAQSDPFMPASPIRVMQKADDLLSETDTHILNFMPESPLNNLALPNDLFTNYWLFHSQLPPDTKIWASYANHIPVIMARPVGKGESIFVNAVPTPQSGNWILNPKFPEMIAMLVGKTSVWMPPEKFPLRFQSLTPIQEKDLPNQVVVDDLTVDENHRPLAPMLFALAFLIFVIDQLLITLRFSGILWRQR